ncbi:hypothetical protein C0W35_21650, partial [Photobacterium kishitanii]|uniref:DUF2931 family protein n=1 Tax=Photobacterium kishitanii TaxID=318456 RepID=UPI000D15BEDD
GWYPQIQYTNHLPDKIVLYWTSLFDTKFYFTEIHVTPKIKVLSPSTATDVYNGQIRRSCYQTTFDFGFLPNGQVKVWLEGCGKYTYVTELSPIATPNTDYNGSTYSDHNQIRNSVLKRAKKANATLIPIPWNKVNKIYTSKNYTVEQLH